MAAGLYAPWVFEVTYDEQIKWSSGEKTKIVTHKQHVFTE